MNVSIIVVAVLALVGLVELVSATCLDTLIDRYSAAVREDSAKLQAIADGFSAAASAARGGQSIEATRLTKAAGLVEKIRGAREKIVRRAVEYTKDQREDIYVKNVLNAQRRADAEIGLKLGALYKLAVDMPQGSMLKKTDELIRLLLARQKSLANDLVHERQEHDRTYDIDHIYLFGEPVELI